MITKFGTLYAGHIDLGELGLGATAVNDRRWDNEHLIDRKSTRLNSSHVVISYAVFCLKKKNKKRKKTKNQHSIEHH